MTEISDTSNCNSSSNNNSKLNDNVSLNKAAHLLGVNELNKFDYKSLNSIRKLAKTLGCNEFDLMKSFQSNGDYSQQQMDILNKTSSVDKKLYAASAAAININNISNSSGKKSSISNKSSKLLSNASQRVASFNNRKSDSSCKLNKRNENVSFNDNNYKKLLNLKKIGFYQKSSLSNNNINNINSNTNSSTTNSAKDNINATTTNTTTSNISTSIKKEKLLKFKTKNEDANDTTAKIFQRAINSKKKLNRFSSLNKTITKTPEDKEAEPQEEYQEEELNTQHNIIREESEFEEGELYFDFGKLAEAEMNFLNETNHINTDINGEINPPKREVILIKDQNMGFGFIAGSEKPLVIRFVSPDGPGHEKLLNGDEILSINDEDVELVSRDYVIDLIRNSSDRLKLVVKQPTPKSYTSLLLTEDKKAFKKSTKYKNKVRFNLDINGGKVFECESIYCDVFDQIDFKPIERETEILTPLPLPAAPPPIKFLEKSNSTEPNGPSEFENVESVNDFKSSDLVSNSEDSVIKPALNYHTCILRVHLENQTIKSFKYDKNTCVKDVLNCLKDKLNINFIEYYGLVIRLNNHNCVSSFILLDETRYLFKLREQYGCESNFSCLFRFLFVPSVYQNIILHDENSFNYLYEQSCNDVVNERFGNELKYEIVLHLATLSILHDNIHNLTSNDLNNLKNDLNMEKYLPRSLLESTAIKQKDLKRLLNQNLEWFYEKNFLNKHDIKLEYLKCMNELLQYSGRIFFVTLLNEMKEAFIIVGSSFGISTFVDLKAKTLLNLAKFESIENIRVAAFENSNLIRIDLDLFDTTFNNDISHKTLTFGFLKEDYLQFLYLLQGYLRINVYPLKHRLCPIQEIKSSNLDCLNVSVFLVKYPHIKTQEIEQQLLLQNNNINDSNCCVLKMSTNLNECLLFKLKDDSMSNNDSNNKTKSSTLSDSNENDKTDEQTQKAAATTSTLKLVEANKEEIVIYETTNTLYEDLNDLVQKITVKNVNEGLNTESLPLIESYHLMNQNEISDLKLNDDLNNANNTLEDEYNTSNNNDDQQTEELVYCFDYKNSNLTTITDDLQDKEETISISSIEPEDLNESSMSSSYKQINQEIDTQEKTNEKIRETTTYSSASSVSLIANDLKQEHNILEIESEVDQKLIDKENKTKIESFSVGFKIDHFNKMLQQQQLNNLNNFHKGTTVASACFRQIKKPIQIEFNEVDVIDLTQIHNQNIMITPPPLQFSDEFRTKNSNNSTEFKKQDIEIESGIESDSSADQQVPEVILANNIKKTDETLISEEFIQTNGTRFSSKLLINLDSATSTSSLSTDKNYNIVPIVKHTIQDSNESVPVSYESKINHFVDAYSSSSTSSSTSETTSSNQKLSVTDSKFTLINYHQPQSKFSTSSSALSYLNEVEIPARLKRSSSFRSNTRRLPQVVTNKQEVTSADKEQMTDSGFMSSFNSLSSSSNSASPPLINSSLKQTNSSSPISSSSSSPTSLTKIITDDSNSSKQNVKSIAKTYETNNNVILPNYFKPKLINDKQTNSIIKIINNNTENAKMIRTKFDSFEMPSEIVKTKKDDSVFNLNEETNKTQETQSITSFNVNEIVLDTTAANSQTQTQMSQHASQDILKLNGYITSKIQKNDTSKEPSQMTTNLASPSILTKQKLVKLNMSDLEKNKQFETSLNQTQQTPVSSSASSFHKVLNKIVETGIQVTKSASLSTTTSFSKPPISKKYNNNSYNFEPINGYDEKMPEQLKETLSSDLKKKPFHSYKSNSLTRQSKQPNDNKKNLFKLNEFESVNINTNNNSKSNNKSLNFFNNFKDDKSSSGIKLGKTKSYNISSSLPSRNLGNKVVDDIKSLFDKFTHSSTKSNPHLKHKQIDEESTDTNTSTNTAIAPTTTTYQDSVKLTTFKNVDSTKLKISQSFNSSNFDLLQVKSLVRGEQQNECPDSPRKGALKKLNGSRDSSATRSPLKVRWKDMIEITDLVEDNDQESYSSDDSLNNFQSDDKNNGHDSDDENYHHIDSDLAKKSKKKKLKKKNLNTKLNEEALDILIKSDKNKSSRKFEGKQQQINLKPLHSTGKQFEIEMTERLNKLNQIKVKTNWDCINNEKFYDEIHADLDVVLFELHMTIEHVRLSSMISNVDQPDDADKNEVLNSYESDSKIEEKISNVAQICRQFVNNSKNMISSALVNETEVKPFVRNAMNSLCSLVVQCLETNYDYLNKNKKLDETRQLLIQILNLLNTFRTTLNITYLASSKQLNEGNMNLLMKQATNLANEISLLIKHFKLLF